MNQINIIFYQTKFRVDDTKTDQLFEVTIGNAKTTDEIQFHSAAPMIKYHQMSFNSCCLSSLASDSQIIGDDRAVTVLVHPTENIWHYRQIILGLEFILITLLWQTYCISNVNRK